MGRGFTLVEVVVAIFISAAALFGIETLMVESYKQWKVSQDVTNLIRDLDLASYLVKGVLEEADSDTILNSGTKIVASYKDVWQKELYPTGTNLIFKDAKSAREEQVIGTLDSLSFEQNSSVSILVKIRVKRGKESLENSFLVYLRNKGGG